MSERRYVQLPDVERTLIRARHASRCIACDRETSRGDHVMWSREHGVLCMTCHRTGRRPTWRGAELVSAAVSPRPPRVFGALPFSPARRAR
jgi:hypothetical protein